MGQADAKAKASGKGKGTSLDPEHKLPQLPQVGP
jgi:hypothetical protein